MNKTADGSGGEDDEEKDMLNKIQRTYERYLAKKNKKAPQLSKKYKEEESKKDL